MTTPIWFRLMSRLKQNGGFSPSMMELMEDAGVCVQHGHPALIELEQKKLISLGPGGKWCRPVKLIEHNSDNWITTIYGGEQ